MMCIPNVEFISKLIVSIFLFVLSVVGTIAFDFIVYRKRKSYYTSVEYYMTLITELVSLNKTKNLAIHRLENMVDTLQVRRCLTLLPTQERELSIVKEYLVQLTTLKSVNEIFSLH
jgi:hypothetical protein